MPELVAGFHILGNEIVDDKTGQPVSPADFNARSTLEQKAQIGRELTARGMMTNQEGEGGSDLLEEEDAQLGDAPDEPATARPVALNEPPAPTKDLPEPKTARPSLSHFMEVMQPRFPDMPTRELHRYWAKNYSDIDPKTLPTFETFLPAAKERNPGLTDREARTYWDEHYGDFGAAEKNAPPPGFLGTAKDMALKGAAGVVDVAQSAVGLASLASGGKAGEVLRDMGWDPEAATKFLNSKTSEAQQAADRAVHDAKGFVDTVIAYAKNPRAIAGAVSEAAPGIATMGLMARKAAVTIAEKAALPFGGLATAEGAAAAEKAVEAAAGKLMWVSSGTEGALSAGQIADQAQGAGRDYSDYLLPSIAGGVGTAVIGRGAGKAMGGSAEIPMFTGSHAGAMTGNWATRTAKSIFSEGFLEEMPQSAQEQVFQNLAMGKPWNEGVAEAAASGAVVGSAMGGVMGGIQRPTPPPPGEPPPEEPQKQGPNLPQREGPQQPQPFGPQQPQREGPQQPQPMGPELAESLGPQLEKALGPSNQPQGPYRPTVKDVLSAPGLDAAIDAAQGLINSFDIPNVGGPEKRASIEPTVLPTPTPAQDPLIQPGSAFAPRVEPTPEEPSLREKLNAERLRLEATRTNRPVLQPETPETPMPTGDEGARNLPLPSAIDKAYPSLQEVQHLAESKGIGTSTLSAIAQQTMGTKELGNLSPAELQKLADRLNDVKTPTPPPAVQPKPQESADLFAKPAATAPSQPAPLSTGNTPAAPLSQEGQQPKPTPGTAPIAMGLAEDGAPLEPSALKDFPHGVMRHAQSLRDIVEGEPFKSQGFGGLDAPSRRAMLKQVFLAAQDLKVRSAIISSLPIDVVNVLRRKNLTPDQLLGDESVLSKSFPIDGNESVPLGINVADAIMRVAALASTEPIDVSGPILSVENNAALGANDVRATPANHGGVEAGPTAELRDASSASPAGKRHPTSGTIDNRQDVAPSGDVELDEESAGTASSPPILPHSSSKTNPIIGREPTKEEAPLFSLDAQQPDVEQGGLSFDQKPEPEQPSPLQQEKDKLEAMRPSKPTEPVDPKVTASLALSNYVAKRLRDNKTAEGVLAFSLDDLYKRADYEFGGTQAQGKYTPKDAFDAIELGVNQYILEKGQGFAFDPSAGVTSARLKVDAIRSQILNKIPGQQNRRTEEQDEFQQFSTPPDLAFVMAWAANIQGERAPGSIRESGADVVVEPSAGLGGLAVFAKNAGATVYVNEYSARRAELLKSLPFERVFVEDAAQLNNILPDSVQPTVVLMNPPFSSAAGRMKGQRDSAFSIAHLDQAMKRLAPGGRLVALIGKGREAFGGETAKAVNDWIAAPGKTLRARIGLSGEGYKKYGTTYDNQVLVFDKMDSTGQAPVIANVEDVRDALPLLKEVRDARTHGPARPNQSTADQSGSETVAPGGKPERQPGQPVSVPTDALGARPGRRPSVPESAGTPGSPAGVRDRPAGQSDAGNGAGVRPAGAGGTGPESDRGATQLAADDQAGGARSPGSPGSRPDRAAGELPAEGVADSIAVEQADNTTKAKAEHSDDDSIYEVYTPQKLKIAGAKAHPGELVESAAMAAVEPPAVTYQPRLPKSLIERGKLSLAQLEAIVYAGQAHAVKLANGFRQGFFIGDGTGVGKGREISGIILDNRNQGRKRALWISKKSNLITDARRDWKGIEQDPADIFDLSGRAVADAIPQKDGILFTSYNTLISGLKSDRGGLAPSKNKKTGENNSARLDQIVNWLGADFDGVIAFDEAHAMQNASPSKGDRGEVKGSSTGLVGLELQKRLPNARIVYVSATGATEVANLAYAERLGLWGEGTAFPTRTSFIGKMVEGGLAAMEVVAQNIKAMGLYVARQLSYRGVTYERMEHKLTPKQREVYDEMARAWQIILNNINEALEATGGADDKGAKGAARGKLYGAQQRFFNQVLTSLQMPTVLESMQKQLDAGNAVVLQLVNTNEASQAREVDKVLAEEGDLEDVDITPREILMSYLRSAFPTAQMEEYLDENGKKAWRIVKDSNGNIVENKEAVAKRDALLDRFGSPSFGVPDGVMEMVLDKFGEKVVAEVTGRKERLIRVANQDTGDIERVHQKGRTVKVREADAKAFMDDKKQVLIFSDAGGTGMSYHADLDSKNQRKRIHYLIQPGWIASNAVQGFGRTHRSNQKQPPHYVLVQTDLKGHKRFVSSVARRLDQMGAITKGQRQTGTQGFFNEEDNLEGSYSNAAIKAFIKDVYAGRDEKFDWQGLIVERMGLDNLVDKRDGKFVEEKIPHTPKFLNRLLALEYTEQNAVFDAFQARMQRLVRVAEATGQLDAGMETYKADSVKLAGAEVVYTHPETGAKAELQTFDTEHKVAFIPFAEAAKFRHMIGFYQSHKSGRVVAALQPGTTHTQDDGEILTDIIFRGPVYGKQTYSNTRALGNGYTKLSDNDAEMAWKKAIQETPPYKKETLNLLTGTMLPIWDRLPAGLVRIIRVTTDAGKRVIGRRIADEAVNPTKKKLGAEVTAKTYTPGSAITALLEKGSGGRIVLANGWDVKRSMVSGEWRYELRGDDLLESDDELRKAGVFKERIQFKTRWFLPADRPAEILAKLVRHRPILDVLGKTEESATSSPAADASFSMSADRPVGGSLTQAELEQVAGRINVGAKTGVRVVPFTDLPEFVQQEAEAQGYAADEVRGVFHDGQVYLVQGNITTKEQAEETVFHELYHAWVAGLLGESKHAVLSDVFQRLGGVHAVLNLADKYHWHDAKEIIRAYGQRTDLSLAQRQAIITDELLATIGQRNQNAGLTRWWSEMVGAVRSWLREHGFATLSGWNESDLAHLLKRARQADQQSEGSATFLVGTPAEAQTGVRPQFQRSSEAASGLIDKIETRDRLKAATTKARPYLLGSLGLHQLATVYGKDHKEVANYNRASQQMETDFVEITRESDEILKHWDKLTATVADRMARVMEQARFANYDPDPLVNTAAPDNAKEQAVRDAFNNLPDDAKAIYREARDFYAKLADRRFEAIAGRIERSGGTPENRKAALDKLKLAYDRVRAKVYFPFTRFGEHIVIARQMVDGVEKDREVSAFESPLEAQQFATMMKARGWKVKQTLAKEYSRDQEGAASKAVREILNVVQGIDESNPRMMDQLLDAINQTFINALPDMSYAKHFTHAKDVKGFSKDALRAFAHSALHGAHHISRIQNADHLTRALATMDERINREDEGDVTEARQVHNELTLRHNDLLNPNVSPVTAWLGQLGFTMSLGGVIATGITNATQVPLVTLPWLGARYGFGKAGAHLARAYKDFLDPATLNAASLFDASQSTRITEPERAMLKELQRRGRIDLTQTMDLSGRASQDNLSRVARQHGSIQDKIAKMLGFTFHAPEVMNRQVTALATYRMEMTRSESNETPGQKQARAIAQAEAAIIDTHFIYTQENRPRYMSGNVMRVLTMFKQYGQNIAFLYGRSAQLWLTKTQATAEERAIAKKQLLSMAGLQFAAAGALGLPFVGSVASLFTALLNGFGDDDDKKDWEVELRKYLAETVGKDAGEVLSHGVSRLTPWDMAARLGQSDLFFRAPQREREGRAAAMDWITSLSGPVLGYAVNAYLGVGDLAKGIQTADTGHFLRGVEEMTPALIRNQVKALRFELEGGIASRDHHHQLDVTGSEKLGQFFGFAPSRGAEMYEGMTAIKNHERHLAGRRADLLDAYAAAYESGDEAKRQDILSEVRTFNLKHRELAINGDTLMKSLRGRMKRERQTVGGVYLPRKRDNLRQEGNFANY